MDFRNVNGNLWYLMRDRDFYYEGDCYLCRCAVNSTLTELKCNMHFHTPYSVIIHF